MKGQGVIDQKTPYPAQTAQYPTHASPVDPGNPVPVYVAYVE